MPHEQSKLSLPPSRPLDVHRWSDYPELNSCLTDLVTEIERTEARKRARSSGAATRLRNAVRCIILDLYVAWSTDPSYEVGVSLGKGSFKQSTRYDALFLRYDTFHPAYRGLCALGYVLKVRPHFHDPRTKIGRVTRIRATPKLIQLLTGAGQLTLAAIGHRTGIGACELIVLRNSDKEQIEYTETSYTKSMRTDLLRINAVIARHWIDLFISDADISVLNRKMIERHRKKPKKPPYLDVTVRQLRRIFNNSDWQQGGRFYGGWWQAIPKQYRVHITINGKHTVEVDYSGMHPALMYAAAGARLDGDAYEIGVPSMPRDVVKRAFNKLINTSGGTKPTKKYNAQEYGLSWPDLLKRIKARHKPIAQFLGTGEGVRLQAKDAQIANRIMQRFLDMGYICLPVHDSFIVHHALQKELKIIMQDEFYKEAGAHIDAKPKFSVIDGYATEGRTAITQYATSDEPFSYADGYTGHESRLSDWWANQRTRPSRS